MTPSTFLTAAKIQPTLSLNLYGQSPLAAVDCLQPADTTNINATTVSLVQPVQKQSSAAIVTN